MWLVMLLIEPMGQHDSCKGQMTLNFGGLAGARGVAAPPKCYTQALEAHPNRCGWQGTTTIKVPVVRAQSTLRHVSALM